MRNYGAVSPLFWIGKTGKSLRDDRDSQVAAAYLMTAPTSHQTGIYYLPVSTISHDTGIPFDGASKALLRLIQEGFCVYDYASEWIWVREMAVWQIGEPESERDKRVIGVQNYFRELPNLSFLKEFFDRYTKTFRLKPRVDLPENPKPLASPSDGPCKPHRSQDQDQDQDQDQNIHKVLHAPSKVNGREQKSPRQIRDDAEYRLSFDAVKDAYPEFSAGQDWLKAEHHWRNLLDDGCHLERELLGGVERYAAYVKAKGVSGPGFVMTPGKFFGSGEKYWAQVWEPPKEKTEQREDENVAAGRAFLAGGAS